MGVHLWVCNIGDISGQSISEQITALLQALATIPLPMLGKKENIRSWAKPVVELTANMT